MPLHVPASVDPANGWADVSDNLDRTSPTWHPTQVYSRLWQGGTPDNDLVVAPGTLTMPWAPSVSVRDFEACVTLTPVAGPAGTGVAEQRITFADVLDSRSHPENDVYEAAQWAAARWGRGDRVLVRCRAGLNRSGLLAGLVMCLVDPGLSWEQAVATLRRERHPLVLGNSSLYSLGETLTARARR